MEPEPLIRIFDKDVVLSLINAIVTIMTIVGTTVAAIYAYKSNSSSQDNKAKLQETSQQVAQLEINTNGIHKELMEQKGKASYLEGHETARIEGENKAAELVAAVGDNIKSSFPGETTKVASAMVDIAKKSLKK